ncbi:MAG: minor extracellular protease Epr [Oleispira sp.]|jgi:minor extracellular protease Epr
MMINRYLARAICLLTVTLPSQAQLLGHDVLQIDTMDLFTLPIDSPQFELEPLHDVIKPFNQPQVTGPDALLDGIPGAHDVVKKLTAINVVDKNNAPVLTEVHLQHGWRALQHEWLLLLSAEQMPLLRSLPVSVISATDLTQLQMFTVRIRVSDHYDDLNKLTRLLNPLGAEILERHHVYDAQATGPTQTSEALLKSEPNSRKILPSNTKRHSNKPHTLSLGVIDTAIDHQHPSLAQANIKTKSFVKSNMVQPTAHATAVLGRLVAKGQSIKPLLPDAKIYAASVFYQKDAYSQSASTLALLQALEWMLVERVQVINMSLAGPPNALLEKALQRVRAQGIAVVAAAGNAGPASRPLFPAAYDSVIAVSAVDEKQRIYRWANRGKHIDFVTYGVNVTTLRAGGGEGTESGTSMAAPIISAALALQMQTDNLDESLAQLRKLSEDLGETGRDVIYGDGFIAP